MDKKKYEDAEEKYKILKQKLEKNELTVEQMKLELKKLTIIDEKGQYWMLGAKTGQWYFYNEKEWKIGIPYKENNLICPFCKENIKEGTTKCNNCNRMLDVPAPITQKTMICPFCKEEIKDGAIKCKHCGSLIDDSNSLKIETKICPFCKEVVTMNSSKCEHCGSLIIADKDLITIDQSSPHLSNIAQSNLLNKNEVTKNSNSKAAVLFGQIVLTIMCLYIGGWALRWQEKIYSNKSFITENNGFAIRFNNEYYGLKFHNRFFDSPTISWILFFIGTGITPFIIIPLGGGHGDS